jgi:hypothetical protein
MDTSINSARIRKALSLVKQAAKELDEALADAERPKPNPPPTAAKVTKSRRPLRRAKIASAFRLQNGPP